MESTIATRFTRSFLFHSGKRPRSLPFSTSYGTLSPPFISFLGRCNTPVMADLTPDAAHFVGLVISLWIWGLYTVIFAVTLRIMGRSGFKNNVVWTALVILYLLCCVYNILSLVNVYHAFITYRELPGGTVARLKANSNPIPPSKDIFYVLCVCVSDALLIWRLRMIWVRNKWVLLIAGCLIVAAYVTGAVLIYYDVAMAIAKDDRYESRIARLAIVCYAFILLTNLTMNALIAGRLWWLGKQISIMQSDRGWSLYKRVIIAIIESGSIYSAFLLIPTFLFAGGAPTAVYIPTYCLPGVVGLVPTLMILRLNWTPAILGPTPITQPSLQTSPHVRWAAGTAGSVGFATSNVSRIPPFSSSYAPPLPRTSDADAVELEELTGTATIIGESSGMSSLNNTAVAPNPRNRSLVRKDVENGMSP